MDKLVAFQIKVCQYLTGGKTAIRQGNTIYVSPAMHFLTKNSNQEELEHLWSKIKIITIPDMDYSTFPPTVRKPVDIEKLMGLMKKYLGDTVGTLPPGGY